MDINSYKDRLDIQVNRSDTIPSDSIRINRFLIKWDDDGNPYEAFSSDLKDHIEQYLNEDSVKLNKLKHITTGDKTKMKLLKTNTSKVKSNPLILRTLRNLKTSGLLKPNKILVLCDTIKNSNITIKHKLVIDLCDLNGNIIQSIDRETNPLLYDKICGMDKHRNDDLEVWNPEHLLNESLLYEEHLHEIKPKLPIHIKGRMIDVLPLECELCDEDDELYDLPMGFGVQPMRAINQVSFRGKGMFLNLLKMTNDITKMLNLNVLPIESKLLLKKFMKEFKKNRNK